MKHAGRCQSGARCFSFCIFGILGEWIHWWAGLEANPDSGKYVTVVKVENVYCTFSRLQDNKQSSRFCDFNGVLQSFTSFLLKSPSHQQEANELVHILRKCWPRCCLASHFYSSSMVLGCFCSSSSCWAGWCLQWVDFKRFQWRKASCPWACCRVCAVTCMLNPSF